MEFRVLGSLEVVDHDGPSALCKLDLDRARHATPVAALCLGRNSPA